MDQLWRKSTKMAAKLEDLIQEKGENVTTIRKESLHFRITQIPKYILLTH